MVTIATKSIDMICQCFCTPIQEAANECVGSCLCLEKNWFSLKDERETLKAREDDLKKTIALKEQMLNDPASEVGLWQGRVAALSKKETQLQDEYDALERCLCSCTPNMWCRLQLGEKVSEELQKVRDLIDQSKNFTSLAHQRQPSIVEERTRKFSFGMEPQLNLLRDYFNDEKRSIIGIHGLGGVGKTTLLSEFNDELKGRDDYHVVIYIEVSNSEVLNVAGMQKMIAHRLGLLWDNEESEAFRAERLLQVLIKKKFVILLDDVRKAFELQKVGIPDPYGADHNGKLIIASRSEDVCVKMEAQKSMIEVKCLEPEVAWGLFQRNLCNQAIKAIESDSDIKENAKAIVNRCGGLPLAINVIGRAVAQLTDQVEWIAAAVAVKVTPSHLVGMDELFSRLKYSYDQLKSNVQQSCFLYCALFPEYGSIKRSQLTNYWIGEGLINETSEGENIIRILTSASLLEKGDDSEVKMHDIIRQLALWLTSDCENVSSRFLVQAGRGLKEAPKVRMWESATRISLMFNDIEVLPQSPKCTGLSTLLLQYNPNLKELQLNFFKSTPWLMVLDLSHTAIKEFPIGADTLTRLQHLNLCHTRIITLPKELANLKELRHLDLSETSALTVIPDGTISVLYQLRVLNIYRSHYEFRGKEDLNLERLEDLEFLGITIHSKEVLEKLQTEDRLAKSTRCLSLQNCQSMKSIKVSVLKHMASLEVLFVHDCSELQHLNLDDTRNEFKLKALTLASLPNFKGISKGTQPNHHLHNLCDLTIESCHKLENVTWVLWLKSLKKLALSHCDAMEQVVEESMIDGAAQGNGIRIIEEEERTQQGEIQVVMEGQNGTKDVSGIPTIEAFGKLKSIVLKDLKNLASICRPRPFPCLEIISVENCQNLKMLPLGCNSQKLKLKQMRGSWDWWSKLAWEDGNLSARFSDLFVPI